MYTFYSYNLARKNIYIFLPLKYILKIYILIYEG